MPLEVGSFINDLTPTNPPNSDPVGQGDDHLRLIKACVQGTLPNMGSIFGQVRSLDVATSLSSTWNTNLIVSSSSATSTVVLTLPPAASITTGFILNFFTLGGAAISLLPSGAASINGAASLSIPERNFAFAAYQGANVWRAGTWANGADGLTVIGGNVTIGGTLSVSGAAMFNSISVSGATVLNGPVTLNTTLSVSGIATFKSGITVSGVSILNGAVTMNGALTVSANATFNSGVSISAALAVGGATTLNGSLSVSGVATLNGAAQFNGAITGIDTISISGAAHFKTTLSVGGSAILNTTLMVRGAATFDGAHSVSGAAVFGTTVLVRGATTLDTTLSVSGIATFKSAVSISGAAVIGGALTVAGTATISGTLILSNGQIKFPATQNASSDVNVLDDYEEGTWTPTVTFATPGTLNVVYTTQTGRYTKVGNMVALSWSLLTATFTPGTASGNFLIQGIPFATVAASGATGVGGSIGGMGFDAGFTFAAITTAAAGSASLLTSQCGSDKTPTTMTATQWDGAVVNVSMQCTLTYFLA